MIAASDSNDTTTLSVVAICKNEEKNLPGFLSCFLPWADEIVIVDDESNDLSLNILESAGKKVRVISHPMNSNLGFSGQRNIGIENSNCDWLLHTDIDERATPEFAEEVRSILSDENIVACTYRRSNYFLHRRMMGGGLQHWNKPQLARRGKHHFVNRVHEVCVIDAPSESIYQLNAKMLHLNDASYFARISKSVAYCAEQADRIERRAIRIRWWHLVFFPIAEFTRKYFFKGGFKDGVPGIIWSAHAASAMFKATAIVWDHQNPVQRAEIEKEIAEQWESLQQ